MKKENIYDFSSTRLMASKLEIYKWDFGKIVIEYFDNNECTYDIIIEEDRTYRYVFMGNKEDCYKIAFMTFKALVEQKVYRLNSFLSDC